MARAATSAAPTPSTTSTTGGRRSASRGRPCRRAAREVAGAARPPAPPSSSSWRPPPTPSTNTCSRQPRRVSQRRAAPIRRPRKTTPGGYPEMCSQRCGVWQVSGRAPRPLRPVQWRSCQVSSKVGQRRATPWDSRSNRLPQPPQQCPGMWHPRLSPDKSSRPSRLDLRRRGGLPARPPISKRHSTCRERAEENLQAGPSRAPSPEPAAPRRRCSAACSPAARPRAPARGPPAGRPSGQPLCLRQRRPQNFGYGGGTSTPHPRPRAGPSGLRPSPHRAPSPGSRRFGRPRARPSTASRPARHLA
mmetsp:Transcript_23195/g.65518  ORF Transcript_23195/g.65518 Transcript_23195/m.65518 type:complete len:304 (-) Transcript_23195:143-1054(-)